MTRLGVFGGSFNPVHAAHLLLAERVRDERALQRVVFMPAGNPPHKPAKPLAAADHRLRMLELALEDNPAFEASDLELRGDGPSYTLKTVRVLKSRKPPDAEMFLIMGSDSVLDLPNWWRAERLAHEVDIIAVERPGCSLAEGLGELAKEFGAEWCDRIEQIKVEAPLLDISATEIRERVRQGRSVRYMVCEPVRQYILRNGLYSG